MKSKNNKCDTCGRIKVYDCRDKSRYCQYCKENPPKIEEKPKEIKKQKTLI